VGDLGWHDNTYPELRAAPPWVMEEMIRSQPALAEPILAGEVAAIAELVADAARGDAPIVVTGCGTSEHAAMGIAALLDEALGVGGRVEARQALEAALDPRSGGVCIGVSHDGGTAATAHALAAATREGAATAAITARPESAIAAAAEHVHVTPALDRSWCHTVAYVSALLAGAALAGRLGQPADSRAVGSYAEAVLGARPQAAACAGHLGGSSAIRVCGSGVDRITARELALKIEEGARLPATAHDLETVLHGHLAACDATTAAVLVLTEPAAAKRRVLRAERAARAAAEIGLPVAAVVSAAHDGLLPEDATPAARVVLPPADGVPEPLAALLGGAIALQLLTLELAHARGTNPDLIRREQAPYRAAAAVGDAPW
jgi:glucosamine--fructose-6-phosphate aminotransferase (isomerizing)